MTSFNKVQIVSHGTPNNNGILDELRIGGTWAAVTPNVPRTDAPSIVTDLSVVTNNVYTGTTLTNYFGVSGAPPCITTGLKTAARMWARIMRC